MSTLNVFIDLSQTMAICGLAYVVWRLRRLANTSEALITEETRRIQEHRKAFERLTDPDSIEADFERGAQAAEMRAANRVYLPREDAGPHARVHTARLRGQLPKKPENS